MKEFRICPACGYGHGFHVYFREEAGRLRVGLICPSCGQSYDPGWVAEGMKLDTAQKGPRFPREDDSAT